MSAFLVIRVLFVAFLWLLWAYCIYAILNPKKTLEFTLDRTKRMMKFYGFKGAITATKRSQGVLFRGHLVVLVLLTIYLLVLYMFGNAFMCLLL
jgi:hypothetical protein